MKTLMDNMTDEALVGMLATMRLAVTRRRHDAHFLRDISPLAGNPRSIASPVDACLPSGNAWRRPGRHLRNALGSAKAQRLSLIRATLRGLAAPSGTYHWADALRGLLEQARAGIRDPGSFPLVPPVIRIVPKPGKAREGEPTVYRTIAVYEDLPTRLLLGAIARYVSPLVDSGLLDCACAFRRHGKPDRDTTVQRIADYVADCHSRGKPVYVAECDIQHFFDSIPHKAVLRELCGAIATLQSRHKVEVDQATISLVQRFVESYDYWSYARPMAMELVGKMKHAELGGPDKPPISDPPDSVRKGLPQGGALSPLLANLLMTVVDKVVAGEAADPELLYFRYCDDMVVLHTDPDQCSAAMKRYMDSTAGLGLAIHQPKRLARYSREFHSVKSKWVYRLGPAAAGQNTSPWMSFLGYQIRHDGAIRVRKDSLDRHKRKHSDFAMKLKKLLTDRHVPLRLPNEKILAQFAFRQVASGVGKTTPGSAIRELRCWCAAFPLLKPNRFALAQMRGLDRVRDRLVSSVMHTLRRFQPGNFQPPIPGERNNPEKKSFRPFLGRGRSYCGWLLGDKPDRDGWPAVKGQYGREF